MENQKVNLDIIMKMEIYAKKLFIKMENQKVNIDIIMEMEIYVEKLSIKRGKK